MWSLADLVRAGATRREFRSRAYRQAVWSLDSLSDDLAEPLEEILLVPGIGPGVARLIAEFREEGAIAELGRLTATLPRGANRLRLLPRMTPNRLRWLKSELGVETPENLVHAISLGQLGNLKGVGDETARTWIGRLQSMPPAGMTPLAAHNWAYRVVAHVERHVMGSELVVTGSIRRLDEWVPAIDLVVAEAPPVFHFLAQSAIVTGSVDLADGIRFDTLGAAVKVHISAAGATAAAVFRTTGPRDHVEAVIRSMGDGQGIEGVLTETDIYRSVGLAYVPPPARSGVLQVPSDLIGVEHLRGDLHLHSDWSPDGRQTIEELIEAARSRGLQYVAITDHAKGLRFGGLDEERIEQQRMTIERIRPRYPDIVILHGSELNIDRNGQVDFDDDLLDGLDFGLAAIHSLFTLNRDEQTGRLLTAIANPKVNVIAHITGRRIGTRPPIEFDTDRVLSAAAEHRTAIEVNGHLDRLDASADIVDRARRLGALFAANSDAHRRDELSNAGFSVAILQRGLVTHDLVVNAWNVDDLLHWTRGRSWVELGRNRLN